MRAMSFELDLAEAFGSADGRGPLIQSLRSG
jgi:hypothetical protein